MQVTINVEDHNVHRVINEATRRGISITDVLERSLSYGIVAQEMSNDKGDVFMHKGKPFSSDTRVSRSYQ